MDFANFLLGKNDNPVNNSYEMSKTDLTKYK
jgi:hypothetical protein